MSMRTGARRWAERFKENKSTVIRESSCFRDEGAAFSIERGLVQNEHRADSSHYGYGTHESQ